MNLFPTREFKFKLNSSQKETIERLERRTEYSKYLTSNWTKKSFRGQISDNEFKIISSTVGKGAFCVLTGEINTELGSVTITINKAFKIMLSILLIFPIIAMCLIVTFNLEKFEPFMILSVIAQILTIRFIGIRFFFKKFSKQSLHKLRDALDVEFIEN